MFGEAMQPRLHIMSMNNQFLHVVEVMLETAMNECDNHIQYGQVYRQGAKNDKHDQGLQQQNGNIFQKWHGEVLVHYSGMPNSDRTMDLTSTTSKQSKQWQ